MRTIRFDHGREAEVPTNWAEGERMLTEALSGYYDTRGQNLTRMSIVTRVAYGMFGEKFMAPDPSHALIFLLQRICQRKGAGLE